MHATSGHNPCRTEMVTTFPFVTARGQDFLQLVEDGHCETVLRMLRYTTHTDFSRKGEEVAFQHQGLLYGFRGEDNRVRYLSPYESVRAQVSPFAAKAALSGVWKTTGMEVVATVYKLGLLCAKLLLARELMRLGVDPLDYAAEAL